MTVIKQLVGTDIVEEDLKHVECYIGEKIGIFIPTTGHCQYAIRVKHNHPAYSFIYYPLREKSVEEGAQCILQAMSPHMPHEEKKEDTFMRYIAIFIEENFYEACYTLYQNKKIIQNELKANIMVNGLIKNSIDKEKWILVDKKFLFYIKEFINECERKNGHCITVLQSLENILVHTIIRGEVEKRDGTTVSQKIQQNGDLESVVDYMQQHFSEALTVQQLAQLVHQSPAHFTRTFKKQTGKTPKDYLILLRLQKAKRLLELDELTITEIAFKCGFGSNAHFSNSFMNHCGMSPKQYKSLFNV